MCLQNSVSQGARQRPHRGVKTDQGHKFQPLLVTLGPVHPPFFLFPRNPPRGEVRLSSSLSRLFQLNSTPREEPTSLSAQLQWRRGAAFHSQERGRPPPNPSSTNLQACLEQTVKATGPQHKSCIAQQNHKNGSRKPARPLHWTSNSTATFFPFPLMGKTTGLNIYARLSKDCLFYSV